MIEVNAWQEKEKIKYKIFYKLAMNELRLGIEW